MSTYCIVAARPKGRTNHLKSEFKLYRLQQHQPNWDNVGWKNTAEVCALAQAGHQILTGNLSTAGITPGEPIEIELRIASNKSNFKISDMPDT